MFGLLLIQEILRWKQLGHGSREGRISAAETKIMQTYRGQVTARPYHCRKTWRWWCGSVHLPWKHTDMRWWRSKLEAARQLPNRQVAPVSQHNGTNMDISHDLQMRRELHISWLYFTNVVWEYWGHILTCNQWRSQVQSVRVRVNRAPDCSSLSPSS